MFRSFIERVKAYLLWPLLMQVKADAAIQTADTIAAMLERAQQAQDAGHPEIAQQLRALAAAIGMEGTPDAVTPPALPEPSTNGHVPALQAPKKPGRPRKEVQGESQN
jgi:hypothetical protein